MSVAPCTLPPVPASHLRMPLALTGQAVFEEEMVHRNPGDASTLAPAERGVAAPLAWVAAEVGPEEGQSFIPGVLAQLPASGLCITRPAS